jgi:mannose-6-phosphate isomerase-like protein (cupin superfamily)
MGKSNAKVTFLNKYFNEDYDWSNFINAINESYDVNNPNNKIDSFKEKLGNIVFWRKTKLTMTLELKQPLSLPNQLLDGINEKIFPGIQDKAKKLTELHQKLSKAGRCVGYVGVVSFTNKEPTTGNHSDPMDVIYCQFIGSVTWTVSNDNSSEIFVLNPGDIIYVPKNTMHEVTSLSPRAALSFMFEG